MYKNRGFWYTSIQVNGKRRSVSLRTKVEREAKKRELEANNSLYYQIISGKIDSRKSNPGNSSLVAAFLKAKKRRSLMTQRTYYYILNHVWLKKLEWPTNKNTVRSYQKHINAFYNWSNTNYKTDFKIYKLEEGSGRLRVFTGDELERIFHSDKSCNIDKQMIKFAYYTGARRGELLHICYICSNYMICIGKGDDRIIKLNKQANEILKSTNYTDWNYTEDYVTKEFKRYLRVLNIRGACFHDLRRTFGYNLILQGIPIYQVSKLLGHKSVRTTEQHYAPLLVTDIDDYTL